MVVDPAQATDAFILLAQGAAASAAAAKAGAGAATTAAATAAAGDTFKDLLQQVQAVQVSVLALPTTVLKDPAVKSALTSLQAFSSSLQGAEVQALKTIESVPVFKQLQSELAVLAKALEPYKQAAAVKLNVEYLVTQLPAPMQMAEKELEKLVAGISEVIHIVSHDGDKDLFNGYPFNKDALAVCLACVCVQVSVSSGAWNLGQDVWRGVCSAAISHGADQMCVCACVRVCGVFGGSCGWRPSWRTLLSHTLTTRRLTLPEDTIRKLLSASMPNDGRSSLGAPHS
jgi:hypothetical protein